MKRNLMPIERKKRILLRVQETGNITVSEMSKEFSVSEETIRRDLTELENEGHLTRVYGGAYLGSTVGQSVPFTMRRESYKSEKSLIASAARELVHSGDTVFLCPSTTSLALAKEFRDIKNITIISNALYIANAVAETGNARIICVGGELDKELQTFNGCTAMETLESYYADKAFVSCTGVSLDCDLTDSSENQAKIRRIMLMHAQERILIADYTKFGKVTLSAIAPLSIINKVICDRALSDDWMKYFEDQHIEFIDASKQK